MGKATCDQKDPTCQGGSPAAIKAVVHIGSVNGKRIQGTILQPVEKAGSAITLLTTPQTVYKPDPSVVSANATIFVAGTTNSDGSVTAQIIGGYDPSMANFDGVVTGLNGLTLTIQAKDSTHTVLLTATTVYQRVQESTQVFQSASFADLKVGETVDAQGKLNSDGSLIATRVAIISSETGK